RGIMRAAVALRPLQRFAADRLLACARLRNGFLHNLAVAVGSDGQPMFEVPDGEASLPGIVPKLDFATFKRLAIGASENRNEDAAARTCRQRVPIDIERSSSRGFRSPFQDVEPPRIVGVMDAHMVGNEIENEAHIRPLESSGYAPKGVLAAELGIERIVVDYVIAVRT